MSNDGKNHWKAFFIHHTKRENEESISPSQSKCTFRVQNLSKVNAPLHNRKANLAVFFLLSLFSSCNNYSFVRTYSLRLKKLINLTFEGQIRGSMKLRMYPSYILLSTYQSSKAIKLSRVFLGFPIARGVFLLGFLPRKLISDPRFHLF